MSTSGDGGGESAWPRPISRDLDDIYLVPREGDSRPLIRVDGVTYPVAVCTCVSCKNIFFYVYLPEFAPSMCCYCGHQFRYYLRPDGVMCRLGGVRVEEGEG